MREHDPNHDNYVGPVGVWVPWDPDAYKTGRVEHMEEELNALHKEKMQNEEKAKQEFEERVRETKKQAIMDNIEKATKSGNVLTQTMDEEGNLTGVNENVDFEQREATTSEATQLRNELLLEQKKAADANRIETIEEGKETED